MLTNEQREHANKSVLILQIIIVSYLTGPLGYIVFVIATTKRKGAEAADPSPMIYFGLAFAVAGVIAAVVVPRFIVATLRTRIAAGQSAAPPASQASSPDLGDVGPLLNAYQTKIIVAAALLEGPVFYNVYLYSVEQSAPNIAVAALLLLGVALMFPFRGRVIAWLESELTAIKQLRDFGD